MAYGDITEKDALTRTNVGTFEKWCKANGDYWALVYKAVGSDDVVVETYTIDSVTGIFSALVDSHTFSGASIDGGGLYFTNQISTGVIAVWFRNGGSVGGDGEVSTIAINSSGGINHTPLGNLVWKTVNNADEMIAGFSATINVSGNIWALPYQLGKYNGSWSYDIRMATVSISSDGVTLSTVDDDLLVAALYSPGRFNIKHVSGDIYVSSCCGSIITTEINSSGTIVTATVDHTDFTGSNSWLEKLDNDWWVQTYRDDVGYNGKAGSFQISDAGVIDNAYTDIETFQVTSTLYTMCRELGADGNTGYFVVCYSDSDFDSWVKTLSVDASGTIVNLQSLEWDSDTGYIQQIDSVAYNMFLVHVYTSGDNIHSETLEIEAVPPPPPPTYIFKGMFIRGDEIQAVFVEGGS